MDESIFKISPLGGSVLWESPGLAVPAVQGWWGLNLLFVKLKFVLTVLFFYFCVNLCFLFSKCIDQTKIRGGIKKQNKTKLGSPTWRGKPGGDCPEVWGNQELHRLCWGNMSESSVRSVHYSSTKWQMDDNVEETVADAAVWDSKEHTRRRLHSKTEASVCFYFFFT